MEDVAVVGGDRARTKRKYTEAAVHSIYLLFSEFLSTNCAALCRFKIKVIEDEDVGGGVGGFVVEEEEEDNKKSLELVRVTSFFEHNYDWEILSVGSAALGEDIYVFPCELVLEPRSVRSSSSKQKTKLKQENLLYPCKYNTRDKDKNRLSNPRAPKFRPLVMASTTRNKLYALSCPQFDCLDSWFVPQEPSFEIYDPIKKSWDYDGDDDIPPPPPFYTDPYHYLPIGYAVLEAADKDGYILLCIKHLMNGDGGYSFYSFNLTTRVWKPVYTEEVGVKYPLWYGEAVVLDLVDDDVIYALTKFPRRLVSYTFSVDKNNEFWELSLGRPTEVEGLIHNYIMAGEGFLQISATTAKIGDRMLCLVDGFEVYTSNDPPFVIITIVLVHDKWSCTTLNSFKCTLPGFTKRQLYSLDVASCFVMMEQKRDGREKRPSITETGAALASDIDMAMDDA